MSNTIRSLDDLYKLASNDIKGKEGNILIVVNNIPQTSKSNDIIGNCLQEWLPAWFKDNGLNLESNEHTQKFPDFIAHFDDKSYDMDIKCWNYNKRPSFDIANLDSFYTTTWSDPSKIFAKYLIIGYTPTRHGFKITDIFLKNLWEITSKSTKYPIGLQVKKNKPYAIRPCDFVKKPNEVFNDP